MQFGLPLAKPDSKRVFHCYASHGKAYALACPREYPTTVRVLCINAARETRWELAVYEGTHQWRCDALPFNSGWRRLGWLPGDDSQPFGESDAVDPELAQFEYLPSASTAPPMPHV